MNLIFLILYNGNMKFSVIVPVYNVEKYITKCLESVKSQTLTDFECLVINDGTKDGSIEVAKNVTKDDQRFIYLDKENGGLSDARNLGLSKAKGEYVFFLDSDDFIDSNLLLDTYNMAKKYDSDIVLFDLYHEDENGNYSITKGGYKEVTSYKDDKELLFVVNSANNKIYKRDLLKDKQFIKGMWYEDMASIPVWLCKANNVSYVNKPLYHYIQRGSSITHSTDERVFDIYKALDNIKKELGIESKDISKLYLKNCLMMTTLRIKDMDDKEIRLNYYKKNMDLLDDNYRDWYKDINNVNFNIKQKIIFFLLKHEKYKLVDRIYH